MFAIVDIETTGGHAIGNGITEIAIAIHDGEKVIDTYQTLINPEVAIPPFIQALTGINHAMVSQAPIFTEVADTVHQLLKNKIFVAHNVNFDYSFVKHKLIQSGLDLDTDKLCTVRLARKFLPGYPSYSLGRICNSLQINVEQRHRAMGDVMATVQLFEKIIQQDLNGEITNMIKSRKGEKYLPPHVPVEQVSNLPKAAGVYYFHNQKGKIVYVGKAKDLKKRVTSHFSNNKPGKQKQEFLREIHNISYKVCGSELMAYILESIEIKRLWPLYNRSLKGYEPTYALYHFEDCKGYYRLAIEKKRKNLKAIYTFNLLLEGIQLLKQLIEEFDLCPKLCFIDKTTGKSLAEQITCEEYNTRVNNALAHLQKTLPSFAIVEKLNMEEQENCNGLIVMEKGRFYGMGYVPETMTFNSIDSAKEHVTVYPESDYVRGLIYSYANKHPHLKLELGQ